MRFTTEFDLWDDAERLSKKYGGAPVVIIVAGDASADVGRCMLSSMLHAGARLRDLLGLLETAKQIESLKHFRMGAFGTKMQETEDRRRARAHKSQYQHNRTGEDACPERSDRNADAHLKRNATPVLRVMGREVVIAVTNGRLDFGTWERIFYGECDGRRRKRVLVKIIGE